MKLVGIMSLKAQRDQVRDLLRDQGVQIYSETDILGHSTETIARIGWFAASPASPEYSTLCFAIVPDENAEAVFDAIAALRDGGSDAEHPIRAFLVPVERMV
jgi:hypothetical protein